MGVVDGNASHLHLEARLCRIWNCYDMFDKLKSKVTQLHLTQLHMGQFLQGGKNGCFVSLFFFTESLRVAKPCKIKLIFRLILVDWVFRIVETSRPSLGKFFGVPCGTPVLALLSDFWVKIRALVRPSLQGWTGFDLLIISGVKF